MLMADCHPGSTRMSEPSIEAEDPQEKEELAVDIRRLRAPNKKKYEEDLESVNSQIRAKEAAIKALNPKSDENLSFDLKAIRAEKDATINRRKKIDTNLRQLNQDISKQMDTSTKIQSTLPYKNEDKINEAMRKLDHQLKTQNFSLREEKRIVAEIDRLRRSKKALEQYQAVKKEIDGMRDGQRRMREERDHYYRTVTQLKQKEEEMKKAHSSTKSQVEEIKRDLEELKEKRRQLNTEYKEQQTEYNSARMQFRHKRQEEIKERREADKREKYEAYIEQLREYEASREPFENEKQLCTTLTVYLQRFLNADQPSPSSSLNIPSPSTELPPSELPPAELENEGMFVLKKKQSEEDLAMYSGVSRNKQNKRSKREKRKSLLNRPIVHTPQIFSQFETLSLHAPSCITDVPQVIEQLQEKKAFYENELVIPPSVHITPDLGSQCTTGTPSVAESALTESIPSTPEVQLDNLPPSFGTRGQGEAGDGSGSTRRLSHDSGAYELEDQNSADEQNTSVDDKKSHTIDCDDSSTADLDNSSSKPKVAVTADTAVVSGSCSGLDLETILSADSKPNGLINFNSDMLANLDLNSNAHQVATTSGSALLLDSSSGSSVLTS